MDTATWTGIAAIALYLGASFPVARQLRGGEAPGRNAVLALGAPAVILHAVSLWQLIVSDAGLHLGLFPVASLVGVTGGAMVVMSVFYRRLEWISVMVFPLAALTIATALWIQGGEAAKPLAHGIGMHILLSVLAQAVLGIASAQSILLLVQHRQLKDGHIRGVMRLFPPIQVMETMLFELLWAGTLLLGAAIITGFVYLEDLFAQHLVHKTVLTLVAEAVFVILLGGRYFLGWRAQTAIFLTLIGFALLVLGFFGSQLVLEYILYRA
jgi:ABC-type uncharacterized transport system permease subunit